MPPTPTERLEDTFENEVIPSYQHYVTDRGSKWKAKSAAYAVGHFPEWMFKYYSFQDQARLQGAASLSQFRDILFGQCPDLQIVFEVALASKHRFLTHKPGATVTSATAAFVEGERLTLPDGQLYDEVLARAFNFLRNQLGK